MINRLPMTLFVGVFLGSSLVLTVFRGNSQIAANRNPRPEIDFSHFPIVDFDSSEPSDAPSRKQRAVKSGKYNNKFQPQISELTNVTFLVNEEITNLPPLPIKQSSIVLVGKINGAKAYLSEDKASVYSEFEVRAERVFSNTSKQALFPDGSILVERFGGRVRFPSGKLFIAAVDNQDMPRVGSRYLLFLSNDFLGTRHSDEDFNILMGYELTAGKVFPLDRTSSRHPISRYINADESTLLTDVSSALAGFQIESDPRFFQN